VKLLTLDTPDPDNTGEGRQLPETKVSKNGSVGQFFTEDVFSKILSYSIKEGMQFLGDSPIKPSSSTSRRNIP
jgi:hypothetical protein